MVLHSQQKQIMEEDVDIVEKASSYIFTLFKNDADDGLVYHNFNHFREVAAYTREFIENYNIIDNDREALLMAAWFHDAGYIQKYKGHEEESVKIFQKFAAENKINQKTSDLVAELILSTRHTQTPKGLLQEILHDADIINIGTENFFERADLLRVEWERFLNKKFSDPEWEQIQIDFLVSTQFYTDYAQKKFGQERDSNIQQQRKKYETARNKKHKLKIKDQKLGRGIETMYRSTYRTHINLSSIADAKANMMISINTIIMSVIIALVGSGFTFSGQSFVENIRFTVPIMVLLVSALLSVIFAILSARPEVTSKEVDKEKIEKKQSSVLFFGNFVNMPLNDFISNLKKFRNDQGLLYDNMSVDIYYLGIVLTRKYRLLRYSYNIFMGGLILCVISFLAIFIYTANANI